MNAMELMVFRRDRPTVFETLSQFIVFTDEFVDFRFNKVVLIIEHLDMRL